MTKRIFIYFHLNNRTGEVELGYRMPDKQGQWTLGNSQILNEKYKSFVDPEHETAVLALHYKDILKNMLYWGYLESEGFTASTKIVICSYGSTKLRFENREQLAQWLECEIGN